MRVQNSRSKIAEAIYQNINNGLAIRAFFLCQADRHEEISSKIGGRGYVHVHNLLTNALQAEFLLCVTRMWDRGADSFSFQNLSKGTDWEKLNKSLVGDRWESERKKAACSFGRTVADFSESERLRALLVSRAEGVAHAIPVSRERHRMAEPRVAKMKDLYEALDLSVNAYNDWDLATNSNTTLFEFLEKDFAEFSNIYFDSVPKIAGI